MVGKYQLAEFLKERGIDEKIYKKWLNRKVSSLYLRDKRYFEKRGENLKWTKEDYKLAIHQAVSESEGKCFYTGHNLEWDKILKFKNEKIHNLPTVDHLQGRNMHKDKLKFVIASWAVNDMKNDLDIDQFLRLCKTIILQEDNIKAKIKDSDY
jgi:hypothetical protein